MNRNYKTVSNRHLNAWQAVAEIARRAGARTASCTAPDGRGRSVANNHRELRRLGATASLVATSTTALVLGAFAQPAWSASCTVNGDNYVNCIDAADGGIGANASTTPGTGGVGSAPGNNDGGTGGVLNANGSNGQGSNGGGGGISESNAPALGGGAGSVATNGRAGGGGGGEGSESYAGGGGGGGGNGGAALSVQTSYSADTAVLGGNGGAGGAAYQATNVGGGGGGGGGGGTGVILLAERLDTSAYIKGGDGGAGGAGVVLNAGLTQPAQAQAGLYSGGGGAGGAGGAGIVGDFSAVTELINHGTVSGGKGGAAGITATAFGVPMGGAGGAGGSAITGTGAGLTVRNEGALVGGNGGASAWMMGSSSPQGSTGGDGIAGDSWSIDNSGTISGGAGGNGQTNIGLLTFGTVGGDGGTGIAGSDLTITNTGNISGGQGGDGGTGIIVVPHGLSTYDPGDGGAGGSGIAGAGLTLLNRGTISGGAGGAAGEFSTHNLRQPMSGAGGAGVSGTDLNITNEGSISGGLGGYKGGGGSGISAIGASTITNSGTITGGEGRTNVLNLAIAGGSGVSGSGLTLINTGTLRGGRGGDGIYDALVDLPTRGGKGGSGISLSGNANVTTSGLIAGGEGGIAGPVPAIYEQYRTNGARGDAVNFSGGGNTLTLVQGYSFIGNVISTSGATNGGDTLALGGSTNASTAFDVSHIVTALPTSYSGTQYVGFSKFQKTGTGSWTLTGTGSAGAHWTIAQGALRGDASTFAGNITFAPTAGNSAAVIFDQGSGNANSLASASYAGTISGNGSLSKIGDGRLILTGNNAYSGGTAVNAGTLSVNGSIVGNTTVNTGGALGGSGSVADVTLMSGGVLAPGNSIGTLTVNGDLTFGTGSIYRVEVDAAGASDKTIVNGNVTLAGTVDVRAGAGNYAANTNYTILTHAGTRIGVFDSVTSDLAFLTPTLAYGANSVTLNLTRNDVSFVSIAETGNQRETAGGVEALGSGAVYTAVAGLSAQQARTAYDTLSGTQHAASSQIAMNMSRSFSGALMNRATIAGGRFSGASSLRYASMDLSGISSLQGLFGSPHNLNRNLAPSPDSSSLVSRLNAASGNAPTAGVWFQVLGGKGDVKGDGNGSGSDYSSTAFLAGYDSMVSANWLMGVAVGYGKTQWDADVPATGNVDSPYAAVYGRYNSGLWQIRLNGGFADNRFETTRTIALGASSSQARSKHRGQEWSAAAEAEYALGNYSGWEVKPLATLRYAYLDEAGFSESGSAAALNIAGRSTQQANLGVGSRFIRGFDEGNGSIELRAMVTHLAGDNDSPVTASFVGNTNTFNVDGTPLRRTALVLGAGLSHQISNRTSAFVDLGYETRGNGQTNALATLGLQYRW